jgi:preprotein translocase subunit SecD
MFKKLILPLLAIAVLVAGLFTLNRYFDLGQLLKPDPQQVARIQDRLSKRFQITGLDSQDEAEKLSLLLRAGSLAAPVSIIEERVIAPNGRRSTK